MRAFDRTNEIVGPLRGMLHRDVFLGSEHRKRRRFAMPRLSFSLRGMCLLIIIGNLVLGYHVNRLRLEQQSVQMILRAGGQVQFKSPSLGNLPLLGAHVPRTVVEVRLGTEMSPLGIDQAIEHLKNLTSLRVLKVTYSGLTDMHLAGIAKIEDLRELYIWNAPLISNNGCRAFAEMKRLRYVYMRASHVDTSGLCHLQALSELRGLSLSLPALDELTLVLLSSMSQLRRLSLDLQQTTNLQQLDGLKVMPNLWLLELHGAEHYDHEIDEIRHSLTNSTLFIPHERTSKRGIP